MIGNGVELVDLRLHPRPDRGCGTLIGCIARPRQRRVSRHAKTSRCVRQRRIEAGADAAPCVRVDLHLRPVFVLVAHISGIDRRAPRVEQISREQLARGQLEFPRRRHAHAVLGLVLPAREDHVRKTAKG